MGKEKFWSRFANDFDERIKYIAGADSIELIDQTLLDYSLSGKVLELGCGTGLHSLTIAKTADEILATDFSDQMLTTAKQNLKGLDKITVEKQNCMDISYPDNQFDAVVMINLMHIISDQQKAASEVNRVLKPGGKLIVLSFTMEKLSFFNKITMIYRYLKTYGKPPKSRQPLTVSIGTKVLESQNMKVNTAKLLTSKKSKIILLAAEKL